MLPSGLRTCQSLIHLHRLCNMHPSCCLNSQRSPYHELVSLIRRLQTVRHAPLQHATGQVSHAAPPLAAGRPVQRFARGCATSPAAVAADSLPSQSPSEQISAPVDWRQLPLPLHERPAHHVCALTDLRPWHQAARQRAQQTQDAFASDNGPTSAELKVGSAWRAA